MAKPEIDAIRGVFDSLKQLTEQREAAIASSLESIAAQTVFLQSHANFHNDLQKFFGEVNVAVNQYLENTKENGNG